MSFLKCNLFTKNFTRLDMWLVQFNFKVFHELFIAFLLTVLLPEGKLLNEIYSI